MTDIVWPSYPHGIRKLSLENKAKWADQVCAQNVNEEWLQAQIIENRDMNLDEMFDKLNTTSIGNSACVALHCTNEKVREAALQFIEKWENFVDKQLENDPLETADLADLADLIQNGINEANFDQIMRQSFEHAKKIHTREQSPFIAEFLSKFLDKSMQSIKFNMTPNDAKMYFENVNDVFKEYMAREDGSESEKDLLQEHLAIFFAKYDALYETLMSTMEVTPDPARPASPRPN